MIFVKDFRSTKQVDVCIFCDKPIRECDFAAHYRSKGVTRQVHPECVPRCAEAGTEKVVIGSTFAFHPDLKVGDVVERRAPCWLLRSDEETVCAYHRWKKNAKPGDAWA